MRYLVTGASGFIGYPLVLQLSELYGQENIQLILPPEELYDQMQINHNKLVEAGFDIIIHDLLDADLDVNNIKPFDVLFHLAAYLETETKSNLVRVNDIGTEHLLISLTPMLPDTRVVFAGSILSLDRSYPDNTPQDEDYPCHPRSMYGRTKLNAEHILYRHAEQTGFEWSILRLPTIYGFGCRSGGMFHVLAESLQKGSLTSRLTWPGRMSLVYVDDVCNIFIDLAIKDAGRNTLYHVSSGEDPTFNDIISNISAVLGIKRKAITVPNTFWSVLSRLLFLPGLLSILPFKLEVAAWRVSLIVMDGMVFNGSKLNNALSPSYTPFKKAFMATYNIASDVKQEE